MTRFPCPIRRLLMMVGLTLELLSVMPSAPAAQHAALRCVAAPGSSESELRKHLDEVRGTDSFYRQLVAWKGRPSACRGSAGLGPDAQESRLEFSWPDGSSFEQSFTEPEIFVLRYARPAGLERAGAVVAALRAYAVRRGLRVDWNLPQQERVGATRIVEYRDPDPGVNGIVRLFHDRRGRLVAVSLSLAP